MGDQVARDHAAHEVDPYLTEGRVSWRGTGVDEPQALSSRVSRIGLRDAHDHETHVTMRHVIMRRMLPRDAPDRQPHPTASGFRPRAGA